MQRWTAFVFLLVLVGSIALVVARSRGGKAGGDTETAADAGADAGAGVEDAGAGEADAQAPAGPEPGGSTVDAGGTLLSGEAPPGLPAEAPKRVRFGVILVQYRGAQGAPPSTRPRDAALALAKEIAEEAKRDFKAALARGDKGSTEDLGWLPRGVLEPAPEYELFSLPKGGVGGPVDTPRGYWIVQRIE